MTLPAKMYTYIYLTKEDKVFIIEDIIKSINSYLSYLNEQKDLILSGGNSQRSIEGIDQSVLVLQNNINILNNKKQEIQEE